MKGRDTCGVWKMYKEYKILIIININIDRLDLNASLSIYVPAQCHKALFTGTCATVFATVVWYCIIILPSQSEAVYKQT